VSRLSIAGVPAPAQSSPGHRRAGTPCNVPGATGDSRDRLCSGTRCRRRPRSLLAFLGVGGCGWHGEANT